MQTLMTPAPQPTPTVLRQLHNMAPRTSNVTWGQASTYTTNIHYGIGFTGPILSNQQWSPGQREIISLRTIVGP
eukprot:11176305-Ditylum_brightwellii.AAC.1